MWCLFILFYLGNSHLSWILCAPPREYSVSRSTLCVFVCGMCCFTALDVGQLPVEGTRCHSDNSSPGNNQSLSLWTCSSGSQLLCNWVCVCVCCSVVLSPAAVCQIVAFFQQLLGQLEVFEAIHQTSSFCGSPAEFRFMTKNTATACKNNLKVGNNTMLLVLQLCSNNKKMYFGVCLWYKRYFSF